MCHLQNVVLETPSVAETTTKVALPGVYISVCEQICHSDSKGVNICTVLRIKIKDK